LLGFHVTVIDDRAEFTDPSLFPAGVETTTGDPAEELESCLVDEDTYIVIVTRGHQHDAAALRACLGAPAAYIGMIGSRRKAALVRRDLLASGMPTDELARVHCPVGLDIGAETVAEIAVSIAAQLVAVRRGRGPVAGTWEAPR
jgi:xanthine dehydrogenase accessory factor